MRRIAPQLLNEGDLFAYFELVKPHVVECRAPEAPISSLDASPQLFAELLKALCHPESFLEHLPQSSLLASIPLETRPVLPRDLADAHGSSSSSGSSGSGSSGSLLPYCCNLNSVVRSHVRAQAERHPELPSSEVLQRLAREWGPAPSVHTAPASS